ncbi:MAG: amidohydrolase family protein [Actinomycetota bacterium]
MEGTVLEVRAGEGGPVRLQISNGHFVTPDASAQRSVDLTHLWVLPGLADCHAHLAADSLAEVDHGGEPEAIRRRTFAQLSHGVFLVIDKGWRDTAVLSLLDNPESDRPHISAAGRIITGAHGYFPGFAVETDDAGLSAAIAGADTRGGWIKLVGDWPQKGRGPVISFGEQTLAQAVTIAHAGGAKVAIHTMAPEVPSMAVRAGVDSIEHGLYLTEADLESLGLRGGAWVPTVANTELVLAGFTAGSTASRVLGAGLENMNALLRAAPEVGVNVMAGTDLGLPHGHVAKEVARLRHYGLDGEAAVAAAGPAAYRYLGIPALTPGASADLVVFEQDPAAAVETLSTPLAGVRAGRVVFDRMGLFDHPLTA